MGFDEGHNMDYKKAEVKYAIWITCKTCNVKCLIDPGSDLLKLIIEYLDSRGWTHDGCQ